MNKNLKKVLQAVLLIMLLFVLVAGMLGAYLTVDEYKPEDVEDLNISGEKGNKVILGKEYTMESWNAGYGALGDNADFFMDGGKMVNTATKDRVYYNLEGIRKQVEADDPDFMLFLDDDTTIPPRYLSEVYEACNDASGNETPNVITGLIKTDSGYLSPMKGFRFIFHDKDYITGPGLYNDITFINSGMTVRLDSLIKSGGFNEELFLDMIDFTLAYELSERGFCSVQVLDETIIQSFSGRNASDKSTLLKRFEIYKKDFKNYCRITKRSSAFCTFALLKRRLMIEFKAK